MSTPTPGAGGHVTDLEMAAFLDGGLAPRERARLEEHLAACAQCRSELIEVQALVRRVRRPRRWMTVGFAAAGAAAVLVVAAPGLRRPAEDPVRLRDGAGAAPLTVHAPGADGATASRLAWGPAPDVVTYRVTVTNADGAAVWQGSGVDTVVVLPDSAMPGAGERYYWVVDALLHDGTTRSTGLQELLRR